MQRKSFLDLPLRYKRVLDREKKEQSKKAPEFGFMVNLKHSNHHRVISLPKIFDQIPTIPFSEMNVGKLKEIENQLVFCNLEDHVNPQSEVNKTNDSETTHSSFATRIEREPTYVSESKSYMNSHSLINRWFDNGQMFKAGSSKDAIDLPLSHNFSECSTLMNYSYPNKSYFNDSDSDMDVQDKHAILYDDLRQAMPSPVTYRPPTRRCSSKWKTSNMKTFGGFYMQSRKHRQPNMARTRNT